MEVSDALAQATTKIRAKVDSTATLTPATLTDGTNMPTIDPIVSSFFDISAPNEKQAQKLSDIFEYAKGQAESDMDLVNVLRDIRYRLGSPSLGQSLLDKIHTYVRLRLEARKLDTQAKAMEA